MMEYICRMQVVHLSEGAFTVDKSKLFIPFDLDRDDLQQRNAGSLLVEIQPFLVVTARDILLFDSGLGFETGGSLQIHQNIRKAGIGPERITKVLMSHLHKDHAGGLGKLNAGTGSREPAFPGATYYIQQREWQYAFEKGASSYLTEEFAFLQNDSNIKWLEGNGSIDGYIRYELTGGHCPFHQVFHVEEQGEHLFFGGDVAPQLQQMKNKFVAKYDYDGRKCMELRQQWWKQGAEEGWTFLFYHDLKTPSLRPVLP
jgi:glyoxylase-like metal-dependent hydrolase (beta-lactamase superfamily II)